ncbi:hypothetical protein VFPBJ_01302 [Purpureocillium lilacinum]|uniref:Uncharacterized protein n=1 Tax=Purpureocillium lilacinum TaxID=33203 RepID=A0A179HBD8_PURLI|nr:hypothetical protein VFPBJ_01302 [Purpureocillium lilacinum]
MTADRISRVWARLAGPPSSSGKGRAIAGDACRMFFTRCLSLPAFELLIKSIAAECPGPLRMSECCCAAGQPRRGSHAPGEVEEALHGLLGRLPWLWH